MALTKKELLLRIGKVDDEILEFTKTKPKLHPEFLTNKELKEVLEAFKTILLYFKKAAGGE